MDYDIWSMGNLINRLIGKDLHTIHDVRTSPESYPHFTGTLEEDDMSLLIGNRIANLKKLYPYISADLNDVLLRFSVDVTDFYSDLGNLTSDLLDIFHL